jgi:hypothetical protein
MNTLLFWSFFALWPFPNSDFGLRSATLNQWILGPLAFLLWAPQFPSYALFDQLEKFHRFEALSSHITVTLLSTALYTGVIAWYRRHRGAAERCVSGLLRSSESSSHETLSFSPFNQAADRALVKRGGLQTYLRPRCWSPWGLRAMTESARRAANR